MEKTGGKWGEWGEMGGNGEIAGMAHGMWVVEGCGGMWLKEIGQHGRKMGEKWDGIPIFHSPISPIFPEVEDLPHSSLCKNQLTAVTDGKWDFLPLTDTHCHG